MKYIVLLILNLIFVSIIPIKSFQFKKKMHEEMYEDMFEKKIEKRLEKKKSDKELKIEVSVISIHKHSLCEM